MARRRWTGRQLSTAVARPQMRCVMNKEEDALLFDHACWRESDRPSVRHDLSWMCQAKSDTDAATKHMIPDADLSRRHAAPQVRVPEGSYDPETTSHALRQIDTARRGEPAGRRIEGTALGSGELIAVERRRPKDAAQPGKHLNAMRRRRCRDPRQDREE